MAKVKATYRHWLNERISPELHQQVKRLCNAKDLVHLRLMADAHLANDVCVGCVFATECLIYPAAIGGDIGCGMLAIGFDVDADFIGQQQAEEILQQLNSQVPINKHSQAQRLKMTELLSDPVLQKKAQRDGCYQLGTLGRGNHFLELQQCIESKQLWLMIHTGSRSMGPAIRDFHLNRAEGRSAGIAYLDRDSERGQAFLHDMHWARTYARENRDQILHRCETLFKQLFSINAQSETLIHCDHNHVISQTINGQDLLIHRKGASSVTKGEWALIPGSMGSNSFHVIGKGNADSLFSSSHGAGRCMSRTLAAKTITVSALAQQLEGVYFQPEKLHLLTEEAPASYKNINEVMSKQKRLITVKRKLKPVLSYKGGS